MTLFTDLLKKFKSNASPIKGNNLLPVLRYLKFSKNHVTKSSMHSFITHIMPGAEDMMVEEKVLMAYVNNTNAKTIEVTVEKNRIKITDGTIPQYCPVMKSDEFPSTAVPNTPEFTLTETMLQAVGSAAQCIDEGDLEERRIFVFIGNKHVCGMNGYTNYAKEFMDDLPEIILHKNVALFVAKHTELKYSESDSYNFFSNDDYTCGFIKPVYKFQDLTMFLKHQQLPKLTIHKPEMIRFNNTCLDASPSKLLIVQMAANGNVSLVCKDSDYEIETNGHLASLIEGEHVPFQYNPVLMNNILNALPDETLTFYRGPSCYFIEGDGGYIASLWEIKTN